MRFVLVFLISIALSSNNVWGIQLAIQSIKHADEKEQHHDYSNEHEQPHVLLEQSNSDQENKIDCWCCKIGTSVVGLASDEQNIIQGNHNHYNQIKVLHDFINIFSSPPLPPPISFVA